jgi:tryptophanyl-tRNA synthetase
MPVPSSLFLFQRIFSGIQPTGDVHLGNYLGAIKNWVNLQNQYSGSSKIYFCIVDLHSLTTSLNREALVKSTRELTATLLACGIDPAKAVLYNQSKVSGHSELSWILTCLTPMSMLKTMTQFKDKSKTQKDPLTGLYSYPILMAADILLFKASHVPVGEDQIQHIELTRELAGKFNRSFGVDLFEIPEVLLSTIK